VATVSTNPPGSGPKIADVSRPFTSADVLGVVTFSPGMFASTTLPASESASHRQASEGRPRTVTGQVVRLAEMKRALAATLMI
jgi:hypothetical protein